MKYATRNYDVGFLDIADGDKVRSLPLLIKRRNVCTGLKILFIFSATRVYQLHLHDGSMQICTNLNCLKFMRHEVLKAVNVNIAVFLDVTSCSLVEIYQRFGEKGSSIFNLEARISMFQQNNLPDYRASQSWRPRS
jgi:hypothetical protein